MKKPTISFKKEPSILGVFILNQLTPPGQLHYNESISKLHGPLEMALWLIDTITNQIKECSKRSLFYCHSVYRTKES